ncbi:MAG: hypothetical protein V2I51_21250 [Anderseniella sp.]|jgi:hypothetical protein|nr:hypothetical protein [Anderseniella sp.]
MTSRSFLDRGMARFVAGLIGALALFGLAMTWHLQSRTDAGGRPLAGVSGTEAISSAPAANPKFVECRDQRTADIGKMLADGVIDQAKHDDFLARAIQTCAGMFPPES